MRSLRWAGLFVIASACGGAPAKPATEAAPAQIVVEESSDHDLTASDTMWHHFFDIGKARDAVIAGQLEKARMPFNRLASGKYGTGTRPEWTADLDRLRAAAEAGGAAKDLASAAQAAANVAGQCGACHRTHGGGPKAQGHPEGYRPRGHASLSQEMRRQVWAAEEMWLGIAAPDDEAWKRGAQVLVGEEPGSATPATPADAEPATAAPAEAVPPAAGDAPAAPQGTPPEIAGVRALGQRALTTEDHGERQALYGELIASCGACHLERGVDVVWRRSQ